MNRYPFVYTHLKKSGEGACLKVLWACLEIFFTLRGTNSKTTDYLNVHSYWWVVNSWCKRDKIQHQLIVNCLSILARYTKRYRKTPAVDLLRLNTWRGTKTPVLPLEIYDRHPRPFYVGAPTRKFSNEVVTTESNYLKSRLLTIFTYSWVQWSVITIFGNGNN